MIDTAIIRQRILDKLLYEDINNDVEELKWSAVSKNIQYGISEKITNNGPLRVVRITDLAERKINWNTVPFHTLQKGCLEHYLLKDGDILFARSGATVGKSVLVKDPPDNTIFAGYLIRSTPDQSVVLPVYASYYFQTSIFWSQLSEGVTSTAQPNFNGKKLGNLKLRVPPLEEQKRIVAKIEELFAKIDEIDKAQKELKELAELAEKKVLDMAVRGELVEQDETEGSGEQLLLELQQSGLFMSKKSKANIDYRSMYHIYKIPTNWAVAPLTDIFYKITDGTHHSPQNYQIGDYKYITAKNINNNRLDLSNVTYVDEDVHREIFNRCNPQKGDILFVKDGATMGKLAINSLEEEFSMLSSLALFKTSSLIDSDFYYYALRSPSYQEVLQSNINGTGITRITLKQLKSIVLPVPPLFEQQRISGMVSKLLSCINNLIQ